VAARAGVALLEGFSSFAAGRFNRAIDLLTEVHSCARAVGGSNAQRDVVDLTLIAAATRAGEHDMARQLVAERVTRRPARPRLPAGSSPGTWRSRQASPASSVRQLGHR
jgi:predicted nucleic acid-binding Zn ribbon protein